jgi:hypothetical protein
MRGTPRATSRPTEKFMRIIVSALLSLSLIGGLAGFAAAPAAAEKAYHAKKKKYPRYYRGYRSYGDSQPLYYERWADRLPLGSSTWWQQMDSEQRGGRR